MEDAENPKKSRRKIQIIIMGLGDFISNEMSNAFERAGERRTQKQMAAMEVNNEVRNQKLSSALSAREEYKCKLAEFVNQANEQAMGIDQQPIPSDPKEFMAYCKLCSKKIQMPITECMHIANLESEDVNNSDLDTKEPSRIIQQAWEKKYEDVLNYGECYMDDAAVLSFCAEQRQWQKKWKRKVSWKKNMGIILVLFFSFLPIMIVILYCVLS